MHTSRRIPSRRRFRRLLSFWGLLALFLTVWTLLVGQPAEAQAVTVYKHASCGCCGKWVEHLEANGFQVKTVNLDQNRLYRIKQKFGVRPDQQACHTAVVDGYVVEGHVPARVIRRLLRERPDVKGLTVPGMPLGSPGMEGPNARPYPVLTFDGKGNSRVYETVRP